MAKVLDIISRYLELIHVYKPNSVGILLTTRTNFGKHIEQILNDYIPQEGGSNIPPKFDLSKGKPILIETKVKKVDISYNDINYRFEMIHDEDLVKYHLYKPSKKEQKVVKDCILIEVSKNKNICYIQNIIYDKNCMPQFELNNKGSTLLKIALKLINTIKDRYKIKTIEITDNSKKTCNGKEIRLGIMSTLLFGTTWYGKYGFYPKNKKYNKYFKNNKIIMSKFLLSNIPELKDMIIKAHRKSESKTNLQIILKNYDKALEEKALLKEYLHYFLSQYDKTCIIFYYFYDNLYDKIKIKIKDTNDEINLTDMYGETFIKNL